MSTEIDLKVSKKLLWRFFAELFPFFYKDYNFS